MSECDRVFIYGILVIVGKCACL